MHHVRNRRPSATLVVACLALFVSIGGIGYAATQINGRNLVARSVSGNKLATGAVGARAIHNHSIGTSKLTRSLAKAIAKHGAQGPRGLQGPPGSPGAPGHGSSTPIPITTFGTTYGLDTFQAATYGVNSQTPEACVAMGRGPEPANEVNGTIGFAAPPSAPPLGSKAMEMHNNATGKTLAVYLPQDGCQSNMQISQLHDVSYQSLVKTRDATDSTGVSDVSLQIEVVGAHTTMGTTGYTTLVYEPYQNGAQNAKTWTIHDVAAGKVWSTHALTTGDCTQAVPCPFTTFQSENPTAFIGDVKFQTGQNSGSGWNGFDAFIDNVRFNYVRYDLGG